MSIEYCAIFLYRDSNNGILNVYEREKKHSHDNNVMRTWIETEQTKYNK